MTTRPPKKDRERPSLSILCEMYGAAEDPSAMQYWYGQNGWAWCQEFMKAAAAVGSTFHDALEVYERTGIKPPVADPRENFMADLGIQWLQQTGAEAAEVIQDGEQKKAIELVVTSKSLDFAARLDRVHVFKKSKTPNTPWIGDYKTASDLHQKNVLQLCGGAFGFFELTGVWVDQGYLLRVEKNPNKYPQLKPQPVYGLHRWLPVLKTMRDLWSQIERKGEWSDYGKYEDKPL